MNPGILERLSPDEVVNPSCLEEYRRQMGIFKNDLIYLYTNLSLIQQIDDFDHQLFEAPVELLQFLSSNLLTQNVLIVCRLWADKRRQTLTLDKFVQWMLEKGIKPQYREALKARLSEAELSNDVKKAIERMRNIRHARLAHIDRRIQLGLSSPPEPVAFQDITAAAENLGRYYNALSFGLTQTFVPVQLYAASGKYHEGSLGYVLDRIALGSRWFSLPEEHPSHWQKVRESLGAEQLEKINEVRRRHRMDELT